MWKRFKSTNSVARHTLKLAGLSARKWAQRQRIKATCSRKSKKEMCQSPTQSGGGVSWRSKHAGASMLTRNFRILIKGWKRGFDIVFAFFFRKMTAEGAPIETPPKVVTTTPPVASSEHSIEELQSSPVGSQNPITYQRPRIINITQVAFKAWATPIQLKTIFSWIYVLFLARLMVLVFK